MLVGIPASTPILIEGLEAFVDQMAYVGAAFGTVITDRLAGQEVPAIVPGRAGSAVRHERLLFVTS